MKISHAIIAVRVGTPEGVRFDDRSVLHVCGYENEPTQADFDGLSKELAENKEFGLSSMNFELRKASSSFVADMLASFGDEIKEM